MGVGGSEWEGLGVLPGGVSLGTSCYSYPF